MTFDGDPLLVHSVSWTGRDPHLVVSNPLRAERDSLPLVGERLAFTVDDGGRYCTGRFVAGSADDGRHEPCDGSRLATSGKQCERCAARDDSRFMHHAHRGGFVPDSLKTYLAQRHWLYVATFADGVHKVGTASDRRKTVRLDEQGAVRATYVAVTDDGYAVRVLEDAVTEHLGIAQTRHASSKTTSLTRALAPHVLDAAHASRVADVEALMRSRGLTPDALPHESWAPPASHAPFFAAAGVHPIYPHPLDSGEHCLTPQAMVGGVALARVNDDDDLVLLDLGQLRGRRITLGDVRSPATTTQHSLF